MIKYSAKLLKKNDMVKFFIKVFAQARDFPCFFCKIYKKTGQNLVV